MQRPGSPAIASISNEVGLYGPKLIDLGLALLRGETVPPYNYVAHRAIRADMVGHYLAVESQASIDIAKPPVPLIATQPVPAPRPVESKSAKKARAA
jgi:hypothetical protein